MERDILKKATAYFAKAQLLRYALMRTLRPQYPLSVLCRVTGGVPKWRTMPGDTAPIPSKRTQENARLEVAIQAAHVSHAADRRGPERLTKQNCVTTGFQLGSGVTPAASGRITVCLRCQQVRRFTATTDSKHPLPVCRECVGSDLLPPDDRMRPGSVLDITYIPTAEGMVVSRESIKDLFTMRGSGPCDGRRRMTIGLGVGAAH